MHLRHAAILTTLLCDVIGMSSSAVQKQSAPREGVSEACRSCLECSHDNGCVRCPERLFLFLQRTGMTHHGSCLHACPTGHYGQRGKYINRCMKCRSLDCDQCFSRDFCTRCKSGFLLFRGKCLTRCPAGTFAHQTDCLECRSLDCDQCFSRDFCTRCKSGFLLFRGKCLTRCPAGTFAHQTDCLESCVLAPVGEWSEWTSCLRDGAPCGFRWGRQTRTRGGGLSLRMPEEKQNSPCSSYRETQRCRMKKRCPKEKKRKKKGGVEGKRKRKRLRLLANGTVTEPPGGAMTKDTPIETQSGA